MERTIIVGFVVYLLYTLGTEGVSVDPVLNFVLFPLSALFLAFLEACEWARANATPVRARS